MGFLDSLLGSHTNNNSSAAVASQVPYLWNTTVGSNQLLANATTKGNADLTGYGNKAVGALNSGYGAAQNTLAGYGATAQNTLDNRTDQAVDTTMAGNAAYQPYAASGGAANTMYANALGLNGAGGNAAATSAFQTSPGYQFSVDQATDAAARKASSLGLAGSGNTLDAITRLGSNLANQEYGSWLTNLQGLGAQGLTAAAGISSNDQAAGKLQGTAGTSGATLQAGLGAGLGTLQAGQGTADANVYTGLGSGLNSNDTTLGRLIAGNNMATAGTAFNAAIGNAQRQDATDSANNGIFSGLIGSLGKSLLGGFSL